MTFLATWIWNIVNALRNGLILNQDSGNTSRAVLTINESFVKCLKIEQNAHNSFQEPELTSLNIWFCSKNAKNSPFFFYTTSNCMSQSCGWRLLIGRPLMNTIRRCLKHCKKKSLQADHETKIVCFWNLMSWLPDLQLCLPGWTHAQTRGLHHGR